MKPQRTIFGHPIGLYVLFFTEMWERFSYYGMRALLITYLVNYFKYTQKDASEIYKVYTSFVYITPILGGFLADRYLGNRLAVIIGAILMAIGHFLMAFEQFNIFLAALIFLIIGNGFFKPNMSTQVGRLYPRNDGRRDGAYTIFYMGINLGAFLSPLICGWLQQNTEGSYHSGFTMAGIGMVFGLVIYLLGQPLIREIKPGSPEDQPVIARVEETPRVVAMTEAEAERTPSVLGKLADVAPTAILIIGGVVLASAPVCFLLRFLSFWDAVMLGIAGVCGILVGVVCGMVLNGIRDRVLSILALGVFVVFFWTAFEQAGNVLNLWADKSTDRYVWKNAPPPEIFPEVVEEPVAAKAAAAAAPAPANSLIARFQSMFNLKSTGGPQKTWGEWLSESLNPVPTAWFQSVNALMIFVLAPVFSFIWIYLDRRNRQPSIPMKMTIGLLFVSASVGVMAVAARLEDRPTSAILLGDSLPNGIVTNSAGQLCYPDKQDGKEILVPYAAGRLRFDPATKSLHLTGALPDTERDRIVRDTAPPLFKKQIEDLMAASAKIGQENRTSASIKLEGLPAGFDWRYAGFKSSQVTFDQKSREITAKMELAGKDVKAILVAAGDEKWRNTINELFVESAKHKVSMSWLILSYLLATIGELCISPVGLSMASKLAPAKFATLLMGMWLLTSSFGNFAAGLFGELAETIPPLNLFVLLTVVTFVASLVLFVLVRKVVGMMHGVN